MTGRNLLTGLSYIDQTYIAESEGVAAEKLQRKKALPRPFLIAALIALMLLLMGCAAAIVLHLDSFRLGEEIYVENMRYREDGSKIPATEKVKQYISMAGMEESKNYQADREWFEFTQSYDPDRSLWKASEGFEKPAQYNDYLAYTQEMLDKIDEI